MSPRNLVEMFQQPRDCRFPRPTLADEADILARFHLEVKPIEYVVFSLGVLEHNILEFDVPVNFHRPTCVFVNQSLVVEHLEYFLDSTSSVDNICITVGNS